MKNKLTNPQTLLAILHDITAAVIAWVLAYALRFNFQIPPHFFSAIFSNGLWVIPVELLFFGYFGLYRGIWRFASIPDLKRIINAIFAATLVVAVVKLMLGTFGVIPRSVLIINPILLIVLMGGSRFAYRSWKDHAQYGQSKLHGKPVIVLGAGEAAISLVKELSRGNEWRVVGLLDDDSKLKGYELSGVKVHGEIAQLSRYAEKLGAQHAIVALPGQLHLARRKAVEAAESAGLEVLIVPAFDDLMSGKLSISQIRKVEVEDLLGREPVQLDMAGLHHLITDKTVLVTGAAGSIGSELCRQILKFTPAKLVCLDISEFSLYELEQSLLLNGFKMPIFYLVGDVKNAARVECVLAQYKPSVVFHAAAYKHVPLMENNNVAEALKNNVLGTLTVARASQQANVEKFVLISTDKAVNPTNVMGASKRLAEMVCQGLQMAQGTRFAIVRFGNVLGSSGSVIPKFKAQIAAGGPITVTHPEMTRYFMSIPEAALLVMQAGLMNKGGEIYVLDMGEPVKIIDLARDMIKLSGMQVDDIKIEFTGLRPGEKLYEELLADDEHTLPTAHEKLRIAQARAVENAWVNELVTWIESTQADDETQIKVALKTWVLEYQADLPALTQPTSPAITNITLH